MRLGRFFSPRGALWVWSIGAVGAMVLAVATGTLFWMSLRNEEARRSVELDRSRALETIIAANAVQASIVDRQRMVRGMVIRHAVVAGDDGFSAVQSSMARLVSLVGRDQAQVARVARLASLVAGQEAGVSRVMADLAAGRFEEASGVVVDGAGDVRVGEVGDTVSAVVASERSYLRERREAAAILVRDAQNDADAIAFLGLMIVVLAGTAVAMSVRGVWSERMREMERELVEERTEQAERMRLAHAAMGAGTWLHEAGTGASEWSPEMARLYGRIGCVVPEGPAWEAIVHPDDMGVATWTRPGGVGSASFDATFRIADGSGGWRWIASRGHAESRDGGVRVIGMDVDVTEQVAIREALARVMAERVAEVRVREAEDAVRQMQKMETVGQMTGGIAHDFNNLLTPIVGFLDMLQRRHRDDPRTSRMVNAAMQSADRARTLVSKLLSFSRRQQLEPRVVDASVLVRDMREFVSRAVAGCAVEVDVQASAGMLCVKVDPNQLENVILNLAVNARDAMPDGGRVAIAVGRVEASDDDDRPVGLAPGPHVVVSVSDTGVGMDAETLRRSIEPFYTTKGIGKGTGLGLSMAHGMAGQSGGALELVSSPGVGTTASIWLPEADPAGLVEEPTDAEAATPVRVPPMRILVVDDEDIVRRTIGQMLMEGGHEVVEASSGAEALGRLAPGEEFDLLVTDYLMPSMTGVELIRRVRETRPHMPVVVVSGYTAMRDHEAIEGVARLSKPFTETRLVEAMARVTAPRGGNVVDMASVRTRG